MSLSRQEVFSGISEALKAALGNRFDETKVKESAILIDLGLDSLDSLELTVALMKRFDVELDPNVFVPQDQPDVRFSMAMLTIGQLVGFFHSELEATGNVDG